MVVLAACASVIGLPLREATWTRAGRPFLCAGTGFATPGLLEGAADDPRVAWMILNGKAHSLAWPRGWTARFSPSLEVFDDAGRAVARAGDPIGGGCRTAVPDVWYVVGADGRLNAPVSP
jgi:hypothetical protein